MSPGRGFGRTARPAQRAGSAVAVSRLRSATMTCTGTPHAEFSSAANAFSAASLRATRIARLSDADRGAGLGIALGKRIVTNHRGTVAVLESPPGGCRIHTCWSI